MFSAKRNNDSFVTIFLDMTAVGRVFIASNNRTFGRPSAASAIIELMLFPRSAGQLGLTLAEPGTFFQPTKKSPCNFGMILSFFMIVAFATNNCLFFWDDGLGSKTKMHSEKPFNARYQQTIAFIALQDKLPRKKERLILSKGQHH